MQFLVCGPECSLPRHRVIDACRHHDRLKKLRARDKRIEELSAAAANAAADAGAAAPAAEDTAQLDALQQQVGGSLCIMHLQPDSFIRLSWQCKAYGHALSTAFGDTVSHPGPRVSKAVSDIA